VRRFFEGFVCVTVCACFVGDLCRLGTTNQLDDYAAQCCCFFLGRESIIDVFEMLKKRFLRATMMGK
jgi:hypothetical protein